MDGVCSLYWSAFEERYFEYNFVRCSPLTYVLISKKAVFVPSEFHVNSRQRRIFFKGLFEDHHTLTVFFFFYIGVSVVEHRDNYEKGKCIDLFIDLVSIK